MWLEGFKLALGGTNLWWLLLGTAIGLVVGVLPGLGPTFGVALMLPFTFGLDPAAALIFLCAIHAACNYGDSVASILLNIPGGPGTVATCWDGYPLAQQGQAGRALGIATLSSFLGGAVAWLSLALLARPITNFALQIGAPEYFALGLMALGLVSVASKGETIKGLIMACVGLALSFVGEDPVTGLTSRFAFGVPWLEAGIPIVVSALGLFAISQVLVLLEEGGSIAKAAEVKDSIIRGFVDVIRRPLTLLRAGAVGWYVGMLPALGVSLAGITSYLVEKKYSRESDRFGQGAPAGLVAAEVGKGACVIGDLIPTFTLGVPGSVTGAILMASLIIHGIEPGPRFLLAGTTPYAVFAGLLLAQASFLVSGVVFGKWFSRIVYLPNALLAPVVAVLCFLGAYTERNYTFDLLLVLALGVFAYVLGKLGYPVVCMVLGLILGPMIESNFHRSIGIGLGSYSIFLVRPIAVVMFIITALFLGWPYVSGIVRRGSRARGPKAGTGEASSPAAVADWGELLLLLALGVMFAAFLVESQRYSEAVRLFPRLVCSVGLGLLLFRLVGLLAIAWRRGGLVLPSGYPSLTLFSGALSWPWSIGMMGLYVLLVYLLGFAVASGVYVVAMAIMMGYRKRSLAAVTGVLVATGVVFFAKILRIVLPAGLVGG